MLRFHDARLCKEISTAVGSTTTAIGERPSKEPEIIFGSTVEMRKRSMQ